MVNQQLTSTQQQLTMTQQQLAMTNQQLSTTNEQLDAANAHIQQTNSKNEGLFDEKAELQGELKQASEQISGLQDQCYETSQQSLGLLNDLRNLEAINEEKEAENVKMKKEVGFMKAGLYIPVKKDNVDEKLADYLNKMDPSQIKIMFMRESSGVYEFGSKRVMVRVERGKIQIKVGGGYLSIDEFLDQYTPEELSKLQRRDPFKRVTDQIAVQKTISRRLGVETSSLNNPEQFPRSPSPIKSPLKSPTKKPKSAMKRNSKSFGST